MTQQLLVSESTLPGVKIINSRSYIDERGAFSRWFCMPTLESLLGGQPLRQINHSLNTAAGTVRGMHYQLTYADVQGEVKKYPEEYKLVRCIRGSVQDVVLDLRSVSPTFKQHISVELSEHNQSMLLIPPGCAHGFQALEDNSQLLYLHTQDYRADLDAGVRVDDPAFTIVWPLPIQHLSVRDQSFELFSESHLGGRL